MRNLDAEYFDVVIVGAGISGLGAAYHLQERCPGKSYVILEGRNALGGTWDLFRYPGIRSDSDMHTLGYQFKPWREAKAIADGPSILNYMQETASENGIDGHIRENHLVEAASWSSDDACWTIDVTQADTGEKTQFRCNFLLMCSGYYSYAGGYTPEFKGRDRFQGEIVHPQDWPEGLAYRDKKVVIIGSGATAMTLLPAMSQDVEHIVMLQRSPTYVVSLPDKDKIANFLRKILPENIAYAITRWKNVTYQQYIYRLSRKKPEKFKKALIDMVRKELGPEFDVETHFVPNYNPWDQRLCLVPNSDLFKAIRSGKASVVTDHVDTFTENGILLTSGKELAADIIITATGLDLKVLGGTRFSVDGQAVDFAKAYTYKGMMYSGVPNMISTFGYVNASWTLRADLISDYTCRLINHMDAEGVGSCTPRLRDDEKDMPSKPYIANFSSGYMQRVMHLFPKQGDHEPWTNPQNYRRDKRMIRRGQIADSSLEFGGPVDAVGR